MGVSRVQGTLGAAMGPPAAMLYAVLPVGVAMIKPSACNRLPNLRQGAARHSSRSAHASDSVRTGEIQTLSHCIKPLYRECADLFLICS